MSSRSQVPIYGNYHGYYNKRPATNDHRLALIPRGFFVGKRVLDVGCNEGIVTCEIAQSFCAKRVIGVDIDDTLVRAAWKHRRLVWSQQKPTSAPEDGADDHASTNGSETLSQEGTGRKRRHISLSQPTETSDAYVADYFPVSCEHMFGPLPVPDVASLGRDGADKFPHNVSFRTADWIKNEIPEDSDGYDVVVAFSVSKWIHLNDGDEGVLAFFRRVHQVLRPGGTFILEPQEWDTYNKARRMSSKLRENAKLLKLRPEDFERVLMDIGFGHVEHLGAAGEGGFRRPIDLYVKVHQ
ncbi:Bin3-domain-containing protein [Fomes fomentarius]|nr:Bin3-domain-containing protein [Fomes fomentarius]